MYITHSLWKTRGKISQKYFKEVTYKRAAPDWWDAVSHPYFCIDSGEDSDADADSSGDGVCEGNGVGDGDDGPDGGAAVVWPAAAKPG